AVVSVGPLPLTRVEAVGDVRPPAVKTGAPGPPGVRVAPRGTTQGEGHVEGERVGRRAAGRRVFVGGRRRRLGGATAGGARRGGAGPAGGPRMGDVPFRAGLRRRHPGR